MSLVQRISDLTTRIGTEFKTTKSKISGNNTGDLSGLLTTAKTSLLAAVNEVKTEVGTKQNILGFIPENTAGKGIANGYAGLDSGGRVPLTQLPSVLAHNKGWFSTVAGLRSAHTTAISGDYAIVGATDTVWVWDADTTDWVETDKKGAVVSVNGQTGAVVIPEATTSVAGLMAAADKTKLNGIAAGATANDTDANLKNRANHTGTQLASTISDFAATVRSTVLTGLSTATNAAIAAADSVLVALGKLQAQITGHVNVGGGTHPAVTTSVNGFMSSADKSKLDGIESQANNYSHPAGDGNLHVPATGTGNSGKVLKAGATAGSAAWNFVAFSEVTGKPTTAGGYGITDVYTKTEIGDPETNFVTTFEAALV